MYVCEISVPSCSVSLDPSLLLFLTFSFQLLTLRISITLFSFSPTMSLSRHLPHFLSLSSSCPTITVSLHPPPPRSTSFHPRPGVWLFPSISHCLPSRLCLSSRVLCPPPLPVIFSVSRSASLFLILLSAVSFIFSAPCLSSSSPLTPLPVSIAHRPLTVFLTLSRPRSITPVSPSFSLYPPPPPSFLFHSTPRLLAVSHPTPRSGAASPLFPPLCPRPSRRPSVPPLPTGRLPRPALPAPLLPQVSCFARSARDPAFSARSASMRSPQALERERRERGGRERHRSLGWKGGRGDVYGPAQCDDTGAVRLLIGQLAHARSYKSVKRAVVPHPTPTPGLSSAWVSFFRRRDGAGARSRPWSRRDLGGGHPSRDLGLSFQRCCAVWPEFQSFRSLQPGAASLSRRAPSRRRRSDAARPQL